MVHSYEFKKIIQALPEILFCSLGDGDKLIQVVDYSHGKTLFLYTLKNNCKGSKIIRIYPVARKKSLSLWGNRGKNWRGLFL